MPIAKLSVDLEARLGRLEQDVGRATKLMEREAGKMSRAFSTAGAGIKGALVGALGALSVGALTGAFTAIVRGIDNLNDLSDATGASVENLSALEDVAARTGTRMETVGSALTKFNAQIKESLTPGSEAARVFELIGLNAKELADIDPAEAMVKTAKALATFADDGNKARVVYALFGKSVGEVAPLLKDLAESGQLVATVTAEQAREAEKFAHELSRMQKNIVDVGRAITLDIIKPMNNLIELLRGLSSTSKESGESFRVSMLKVLAAMLPLPSVILATRAATGELAKVTSAAGGGRGFVNPANVDPRVSIGALPLPTKGAGAGAARISEAERYLESLHRQVEASLELTAVERVLYDLNNGRLTLSNGITKEQLILAAQVIDNLKEEAKWQEAVNKAAREAADNRNKEYEGAIAAAEANMQADRDRLRGMLARTPGGEFAQQQKNVDFLQRMLEQGKIDIAQYGESIREVFGLAQEELKKTKGIGEELGLAFSSAFEDAIVGGKSLRDILKGIEADITRIILRKLVTEPAAEWLTGAIKGVTSGSGGGGFMASVGSWFSSLFSGGFAEGGYIPPGKWGMTGERGPEPVFGGRTGATVRPYSGAVTVNISVPGTTDGRTAQQVAVAAARAVSAAQRRGG